MDRATDLVVAKRTLSIGLLALLALAGCGGEGTTGHDAAPDPPVEPATEPGHTAESLGVLEGQPNFRDLGGYETADGRRVKSGEIYRSGELSHLTGDDVAALKDLEIRTVVNFLLPEEIDRNGTDRLPDGVREVPEPIHGERAAELTMVAQNAIQSAEFERIPPEMNPEFHRLLLDEGKNQYAALIRHAADPANRPLVFHCSHGVHRTGTATAIILSALGVPWETIRDDYLLTNEYRRDETEQALAKIRQMAAGKQGLQPEEVDMTNVEAFYILDGSYIDGSMEQSVTDYGSMEAYIREGLGLTDDEIDELRRQLLE